MFRDSGHGTPFRYATVPVLGPRGGGLGVTQREAHFRRQ
jgi:hypothetical protein